MEVKICEKSQTLGGLGDSERWKCAAEITRSRAAQHCDFAIEANKHGFKTNMENTVRQIFIWSTGKSNRKWQYSRLNNLSGIYKNKVNLFVVIITHAIQGHINEIYQRTSVTKHLNRISPKPSAVDVRLPTLSTSWTVTCYGIDLNIVLRIEVSSPFLNARHLFLTLYKIIWVMQFVLVFGSPQSFFK